LLQRLGLLFDFDLVHHVAIGGVRLCNAQRQVVLCDCGNCACDDHGSLINFRAQVRARELRFGAELLCELLLNLIGGSRFGRRRRRTLIGRHLLPWRLLALRQRWWRALGRLSWLRLTWAHLTYS